MIVIESVYQVMPLVEIEVKRKDFCDYIGFLLTFGYLASMNVSLFLTIERYLATVFCLKPDLRMKMKHLLLAPLLATTASLALSIWAQLFKAWTAYSLDKSLSSTANVILFGCFWRDFCTGQ